MSEVKKSTSSDSKKSSSSSESSSSSSSASSGGSGKSQRESVGGSKEVHYGYFSSVRTPEYRSGWDAIWGKKSKSSTKTVKNKVKKLAGPVELDLAFDKLPDNLREALMEHVRKKLRRTPNGFKKLQESGAVDWNLTVRIDP
ncbi:MAG: hypothetical protein VX639_04685 [Pseudomonadota bacterium]|nr:hypothetical protein [Pseudomonadota bacterium]MEC7537755.1 hypothetical protein [Pseudomonadota bacterium]